MLEQESGRSINFTNFADWCKHFDTLSEAARHTVELLLEYAGTSDIDEANRILSNSSKLKLNHKNISDITPLQSLTHLTYLNLYDNQILDIKPLEFLSNLTELDLNFNKISNIIPLQSLTNLTELDLSYNQIFNIKPLQSLTN
jgi:internalin A